MNMRFGAYHRQWDIISIESLLENGLSLTSCLWLHPWLFPSSWLPSASSFETRAESCSYNAFELESDQPLLVSTIQLGPTEQQKYADRKPSNKRKSHVKNFEILSTKFKQAVCQLPRTRIANGLFWVGNVKRVSAAARSWKGRSSVVFFVIRLMGDYFLVTSVLGHQNLACVSCLALRQRRAQKWRPRSIRGIVGQA